MFEIIRHKQFKKDYKLIKKQQKNLEVLKKVITLLVNQKELPRELNDHTLYGRYKDTRECHLESDWLLIYKINEEANELCLIRTGSHSELFE